MKTKTQLKLVTDAIKNTTTYNLKQIELKIENASRVVVWSTNSHNGAFHSTETASMVQSMGFNAYVSYNEEEERCELVIF